MVECGIQRPKAGVGRADPRGGADPHLVEPDIGGVTAPHQRVGLELKAVGLGVDGEKADSIRIMVAASAAGADDQGGSVGCVEHALLAPAQHVAVAIGIGARSAVGRVLGRAGFGPGDGELRLAFGQTTEQIWLPRTQPQQVARQHGARDIGFQHHARPQRLADQRHVERAAAKAAGVIGALVVGGHYVLKPVLRVVAATRMQEIFIAMALLIVVGTAAIMEAAGISVALGAFVAGVLLGAVFAYGPRTRRTLVQVAALLLVWAVVVLAVVVRSQQLLT